MRGPVWRTARRRGGLVRGGRSGGRGADVRGGRSGGRGADARGGGRQADG
ncbi:cell surface glycoprotein [Peterkaempfera bronchialis]|uniref:Cell surface glycoprotein n=1 Tax=Peterkaempfera bronchialis TaxID=2126346 RepID=A0A345T522_9ACTN|nr:cell surface glycoprotein [Peterkaempfera bronchialis]